MPEWVSTILFFLAVGLSAAKLNEDFAEKGLLGYGLLLILTFVFAGAVGLPYL